MTTLAELLDAAQWADGVLMAGDLGRNSETTAMLENFASKYSGQLTITKDAADFFCAHPTGLVARPNTTLVITTAQLQKLGTGLVVSRALTSNMGIVQAVDWLHDFTLEHPNLHVVTRHLNQYLVAVSGQVSTTAAPTDKPIWRVSVAAAAATWWLQTPTKPFESLTSSLL
jgi:thymidine phosphorylase